MPKLILLDLDGTLTDTAHTNFKQFKDGLADIDLQNVPIIPGATEFVSQLKGLGYFPCIISDSHPRFVKPIAENAFGTAWLSLADKPNPNKTIDFLNTFTFPISSNEAFMVGDTWLDIELGRSLGFPTILTKMYVPSGVEQRDGIGNGYRHIKSGPTFFADNFQDVLDIIAAPTQHLLAVEGAFQNTEAFKAVKWKTAKDAMRFIAHRSLGRQNAGECDRFGVAAKYFEFQRADRSEQTMKCLANAVEQFIAGVNTAMPKQKWDYFSYVSDKATTQPPNKLRQLFERINTPISKVDLVIWEANVQGSIRNQPNLAARRNFVHQNIKLSDAVDLTGKNIIMLDDQFTTGGTADIICSKLVDKGAGDIVFVTLFYLLSTVSSQRLCPYCNAKLQVKIRRSDGNKFLACPTKQYGGNGCGKFTENLPQ